MALANLAQKVLVWLHGPRCGIAGDALNGSSTALVLDGVPVATTRAPIFKTLAGSNGAGAVTLAGAVVGDNVISVTNLSASPPADVSSSFEGTISVAGQIQQSAATNFSASGLLFLVQPQS